IAHAAAAAIDYRGIENMTDEELIAIRDMYDVFIVEVINKDGLVIRATEKDFENYNMYSSEQSSVFMAIAEGKTDEVVQDFMPTGQYDDVSLMYVGVKSKDGLVQIAFDDKNIAKFSSLTDFETTLGSRHVGENGTIYITDAKGIVLAGEQKGKTLKDMGVELGSIMPLMGQTAFLESSVNGVECYCRYENIFNEFSIFTTLPMSEVYAERNANAYETAFADILLFTVVFLLIYILVQKIIVNNLDRINESLAKITRGNLDETVDVRASSEFASLSDDINLTVTALKGYIEQAEKRIEEELEFARQIQSAALPKVFKFPRDEFEIFASMDPAKEVGGDFYDFFFVDKNKIALVIADVSGKGIPAALFMMRGKTAIKSLAESGRSPSAIFEKANDVLCEGNDADMFVTAWIGIVDLETGKVQCANAGHEYPAIQRADGKWELFKDKHSLALAAMEGMPFKEYEMQLNPGDKLFVYTDGVPEAIDKDEVQFGTDRMLEALDDAQNTGMKNILPFVRTRISNFVNGADQFDDITMLGFDFKHKA
ncbi:MAG: SpoIIE family protein phosphatase, partial [Firmicutes bacterium]|nr:SpoIIE family protein phosphatase [Bacillota bacterium]